MEEREYCHNVIIGTAGHVDHGKSSVIRCLTGVDPDRLPGEKKQGITIELGFASLDLPDGTKAGIVDVPGHEKFIKNMLAGAGGVDLCLLVVAADEGVMPQTLEHLEIMSLLHIKQGIIVLNKIDLVEEDFQELAAEDVREACRGTFLEGAPLVPVSTVTKAGIEELKELIFSEIQKLPPKDISLPYRQAIDRVFTLSGFGTIVTGTVITGQVHKEDEVMVYPEERRLRVRNIQVHNKDTDRAVAGQRAALNLAQVGKKDLDRGAILAQPGSLMISPQVLAAVKILPRSTQKLKSGQEVHFHSGSAEQLVRVRVYGNEESARELSPGETGFVQLNAGEDMAHNAGDYFVLRFFSPLFTMGGGTILDACPPPTHFPVEDRLTLLRACLEGDPYQQAKNRLLYAIATGSQELQDLATEAARVGFTTLPADWLSQAIAELLEAGEICALGTDGIYYLSLPYYEAMKAEMRTLLHEFHANNPLKAGMREEEVLPKLWPLADPLPASLCCQQFIKDGLIKKSRNQYYALPDFEVVLTPADQAAEAKILKAYQDAGFTPDIWETLEAEIPRLPLLVENLQEQGQLYMLDKTTYLHQDGWAQAWAWVEKKIQEDGSVKLGDFRDYLGTSRKYAILILEQMDRRGLTRLKGEARVFGRGYVNS